MTKNLSTPFLAFLDREDHSERNQASLYRAFMAGAASGRNYVADREVHPTKIVFTNGRRVEIKTENGKSYLEVTA